MLDPWQLAVSELGIPLAALISALATVTVLDSTGAVLGGVATTNVTKSGATAVPMGHGIWGNAVERQRNARSAAQ